MLCLEMIGIKNGGGVMVPVCKDVNPKFMVRHVAVEALIIQVTYNGEHI